MKRAYCIDEVLSKIDLDFHSNIHRSGNLTIKMSQYYIIKNTLLFTKNPSMYRLFRTSISKSEI